MEEPSDINFLPDWQDWDDDTINTITVDTHKISSSTSPSTVDSNPPSTIVPPAGKITSRRTRRPIPCKGHTKSRRGCFNCKRRRVKCPETRPQCDHCIRLGLQCEYPRPKTILSSSTASPETSSLGEQDVRVRRETGGVGRILSASPPQFNMDDLRFFQHFLLTAYPPLPLGGEEVWKGVARMSHSFDYLTHAMLGLAASHLSLSCSLATSPTATDTTTVSSSSTSFAPQALSHRIQSINLLNTALNKPCTSRAEGEARFATLMALTFQSSYMADGMLEFLSMVRGCVVIPRTAMISFEESSFGEFSSEKHIEHVYALSGGTADAVGDGEVEAEESGGGSDGAEMMNCYRDVAWYKTFVDQGIASLRAVEPLCEDPFEKDYYSVLLNILEKSKISSTAGFAEIVKAYSILEDVTHQSFSRFISPSNCVAQILLAHFFLIEHEIGMVALQSISQAFPFRGHITASWIHDVAEKLPSRYSNYLVWPLGYSLSGNMRGKIKDRSAIYDNVYETQI